MKLLFFILCLFSRQISFGQNTHDIESSPVSMDSLFKAKEKESIGRHFPVFNAKFNRDIITRDSLKGKIVFINFWFEACPPCIAELSALNELYKKLAVHPDFEFISFTFESPEKIVLLKKKFNIKYKVASVTSQECYRLNQNNGFPTSIILDHNGIIKHLYTGGNTDKEMARDFILETVCSDILAEFKP